MFASKVTISEDTLKLNSTSYGRRQEIRKELVKAFIRKQPSGETLRKEDLITAAGYDNYANGFSFIKGMLRRGEITESRIPHSWSAHYTVPEDVFVHPAPVFGHVDVDEVSAISEEVEALIPAPLPLAPLPQESPVFAQESFKIVQQAKDFAWAYESDSLRDFIKFLETGNAPN